MCEKPLYDMATSPGGPGSGGPGRSIAAYCTALPGAAPHTLTVPRRLEEDRYPMTTSHLHDLSIAELADLIAGRKLSPIELVEALIQRVQDHDGQIHAFITPTFE